MREPPVPMLEAAAQASDDLAEATRLVFQQHPQMAIFTSFPGLGELPAARLLAEIGDDSTRFADGRSLKAYAGAAVGYLWTFAALRLSTGARAHYLAQPEEPNSTGVSIVPQPVSFSRASRLEA